LSTDILIAGGGIIGLATAWELSGRGYSVSIIERGQCGAESSWAGGGILSQLMPWDYVEAVGRLCSFSTDLYPAWVQQLESASAIDPEYWRCGLLVSGALDDARAEAWRREHGMTLRRVRPGEVSQALALTEEVLWLPDVAQVRNPRLLKALRRALEERGVKLLENTPVTGWKFDNGKLLAACTPGAELAADNFIVCAGAWSSVLLSEITAGVEISPVRGQMLLYQAEAGLLTTMVAENGHYLIPRRDGLILAGSTLEEAGFDKSVTTAALHTLGEWAGKILAPLSQRKPIKQWAGLRPGSPGNVPVISRHPQLDNLYLNSGHFRYGVTMAPGSARLMAEVIAGETTSLDAGDYAWAERANVIPRSRR